VFSLQLQAAVGSAFALDRSGETGERDERASARTFRELVESGFVTA
jgi:hypothetical protein